MANHTIRVGADGGCNPDKQPVKKGVDTVDWESVSGKPCTVVFRAASPFTKSNFNVPAKGKSEQARQRPDVEVKPYDYDVQVAGGPSADPVIDIKP